MVSKSITIGAAFDTKAANSNLTHFIQKSNEFKSLISVQNNDRRANAKSLLGVMALGLTRDMSVTLTADGPDEAEAVEQLSALMV